MVILQNVNTLKSCLKILLLQIEISMEYPLRPPFFSLNLFRAANLETESETETEANEWFNELRAMEGEVSN